MKEDLLQFIWKFKYFNRDSLKTTNGDEITIINSGTQNFDQGPDFLNAKIRINDTIWVGNVELHLSSKLWNQHHHQSDEKYKNVILHVVWKHDGEVKDISGTVLPTLELNDRVSKLLLVHYRQLMEAGQKQNRLFIPCENLLNDIDSFKWSSWKARLSAERLEQKTGRIMEVARNTDLNWEETLWRLMAANFGGKVNGALFLKMAETIPQRTLARHRNQLIAIEAILFGQIGLLNGTLHLPYPQMLKREYAFYQKKYHFQKIDETVCFSRMRPANFPTIRLAQLAALICHSSHLFSRLKEIQKAEEVKDYLRAKPNDFWLYHYKLDEEETTHAAKEKIPGRQMIDNLMINTVCPILFAYGKFQKDEVQKEKALNWLQSLRAEKNAITKGFERLKVENNNASDSQALIQLRNFYCEKHRCLECNIGAAILGRDVH